MIGILKSLPFLELWRRYESSKVSSTALHSALPPVWILLVDDLNDVPSLKLQTCLFAWDEVICGRVIIELSPHVHLEIVNKSY